MENSNVKNLIYPCAKVCLWTKIGYRGKWKLVCKPRIGGKLVKVTDDDLENGLKRLVFLIEDLTH